MELDLSAYSVRTDLALEANEMASSAGSSIPGVHTSNVEHDGIRVSLIDITSQEGSRRSESCRVIILRLKYRRSGKKTAIFKTGLPPY